MENKDVWIIEVADDCTADEFSPLQTKLLKEWVSKGGVLWANNNVVVLLGIHCLSFPEGKGLECAAAGNHAILEGVKTVRLNDTAQGTHSLKHDQAIPLLALKKVDGPAKGHVAAGTAVWSLVPCGSGWVSNPKPVDLKQNDGAVFWSRFCQFCLRELSADGGAEPASPNTPNPGATPPTKGALSGVWRTTPATSANCRLTDDGKNVAVELASTGFLKKMSGTLARDGGDADATTLAGDLVVVFRDHPTETFPVHATVTIVDANTVEVHFDKWPVWGLNGRFHGAHAQNDIWKRTK